MVIINKPDKYQFTFLYHSNSTRQSQQAHRLKIQNIFYCLA